MCNILILKPGIVPEWEKFENMCFNNWHSYGLVTIVDGKLDIKKKVPESGEIDPKELFDLVVADKEYTRIVHVRHATAGLVDLENCHPMDVYYDAKSGRQVVFMHNGTLYEHKSKKQSATGTWVDDDTGPSDTTNFVNNILIPYTAAMNFGSGHGDIKNFKYREFIRRFWPGTSNRGVLISNECEPFTFGDWKTEKDDNGQEYQTANTDYFTTLKRGPEFERREAARKAAADKSKSTGSGSSSGAVTELFRLSDFTTGTKHGFYQLSTSPCSLLNDWDFYDRENAQCVGYLTRDELAEIYKHESDCVAIMDWVFTDYACVIDELSDTEDKLERATKRIAGMAEQLKKLGAAVAEEKEEKAA